MNDNAKPPKAADKPTAKNTKTMLSNFTPANAAVVASNVAKLPKKFWSWGWPKLAHASKKTWIVGGVILVLLLVGGWFGYGFIKERIWPKDNQEFSIQKPPVKPKIEPERLTGIPVDPELNKRPVIGVMIENSPDARPQASLGQAGIVFEAIAEGGITRFLALYQTQQPKNIGPVRSVRPYYLDWVMPFDAAIVHAGGSAQGLNDIASLGVKDLNHNSSAFRRASNRFAPHNLYTSFPALDDYGKSKGFTTSDFRPWPRAKNGQPAQTPDAKTIELNISGFNYNPRFEYDPGSNSYKRFLAGVPHTDENTGEQISPNLVVVLVINRTQNGIYSVYQTGGAGNLVVFQNGTQIKGRWSKEDRKSQYIFTDSSGQLIKLNPGLTWVSVVSADNAIVVK